MSKSTIKSFWFRMTLGGAFLLSLTGLLFKFQHYPSIGNIFLISSFLYLAIVVVYARQKKQRWRSDKHRSYHGGGL